MKLHLADSTIVQVKLAGVTGGGAVISLAEINGVISFIAGCIAIVVGLITIYRFVQDMRQRKRNKK